MGYLAPSSVQAWTAEQEAAEAAKAEKDGSAEKAAEAEKKGPRRKGKQLDEAVRCPPAPSRGLCTLAACYCCSPSGYGEMTGGPACGSAGSVSK